MSEKETGSGQLALADGRTLGFAEYGIATGRPLIYLHGGASSRLEPAYADEFARRNGVRVIAMDRPGYGRSTFIPECTYRAVGLDVLLLADHLGVDRFAVTGMSAGAPYAMRLASSPAGVQRVSQVFLINPSPDTSQAAWKRTPLHIRALMRLSRMPLLLRHAGRRLKANPARVAARVAHRQGWSAAELELFRATIDEGMRGPDSLTALEYEARMILGRSWSLDWQQVKCPVLAFCGETDQSRTFYLEMAKLHASLSVQTIPGPHMPIVDASVWDRIGGTLAAIG